METNHFPVLLEESVSLLTENRGKIYVDATVGLGGHSYEILKRNPDAFLIGIDKDPYALDKAKERLREFEGRFALYQADYKDIDLVLKEEGIEAVDGILMDLGVSMLQLKTPERGFSFMAEAPLDMRMNPDQRLTAYDVVNRYKEKDLARIIKEYGEERFAYRIAKAIVSYRRKKPIETTKELAEIVESAVPKGFYKKIHPATKTFQAIRIEVNKELDHLKEALLKIPHLLNPKGRVAIISFHSLEDRLVKHAFRNFEKEGLLKVITKKPITPSEEEIKLNPPSRSAKLRVAEKL
ncbi:MAG: 16S rRNA (cytosine(1402)-N(4))-methyltransferase RsmH [Aquificae bacterium]|nr:16S rRNA (cytosine(1402)-N(4))-methyltransferase RsmH [Aquificota bacterium]